MDVGIFGNKLHLRGVNVGSNFDDLQCDLVIDRRGETKLLVDKTEAIVALDSIDPTLLSAAVDYLNRSGAGKAFNAAIKKMHVILERTS